MSDILPKCLDKCQYSIESRDERLPPLCKQAAITQNQCMPVLHALQRGRESVKRILVAKGCTGGVRIMTEGWESYRVAISKSPSKKRSWNKRTFIQRNGHMQEWFKAVVTTVGESWIEHFEEFGSLTENLQERFHEQGINLGRRWKEWIH
jgi:hypothetical protein